MHQLSLLLTAVFPTLGVLTGSQLTLLAGSVLVICLLVATPQLRNRSRPRALSLAVHGVTLLVLAWALMSVRVARFDAVLVVLMLGIFNRYLLRAGHRDDLIVIGASAVLLSAATTITAGIGFAALIVAYVPTSLWALWTSMLLGIAERTHSGTEKERVARDIATRKPPPIQSRIAIYGLSAMVTGYLSVSLMPRYSFTSWLGAGAFMSFSGGMDSMRLQSGGVSNRQGGAVVARLTPLGSTTEGDLEGLYLRSQALDSFDGRDWQATKGKIFPLRNPRLNPPEWAKGEKGLQVEVRHERSGRKAGGTQAIFAVGRRQPTELSLRSPERWESGGWLTRLRQASVQLTYKVRLDRQMKLHPYPPFLNKIQAQRFTELPDTLDPRIVDLSNQLTVGKRLRREKLEAILSYFSKGFEYSLDALEGEEADPLVRFLFEAKKGHCELYAGAVAVLARAAGIPARVAVGFYGGRWNNRSEQQLFTVDNAHAWVEVQLSENYWIWVDATPEDARARNQEGLSVWLMDSFDALEGWWYTNVLDFDEQRRRKLVGEIKAEANEQWEAFEGWWQGEERRGKPKFNTSWLLLPLIPVGILVLFIAIVLSRRNTIDRLGPKLRKLLGGADEPHLPLTILAERLPEDLRLSGQRLVAGYEAYRFGPEQARPPKSDIKNLLSEFKKARSR